VREQFGDSAPEKLLFRYFNKRRQDWQQKIAAGESLLERCQRFVALWEKEGAFAEVKHETGEGLRIEEFHNPLAPLYHEYPNARRLEIQLMEQLLGSKVTMEERQVGKAGQRMLFLLESL
jgi:predicted ArsR family transcriptional regulator